MAGFTKWIPNSGHRVLGILLVLEGEFRGDQAADQPSKSHRCGVGLDSLGGAGTPIPAPMALSAAAKIRRHERTQKFGCLARKNNQHTWRSEKGLVRVCLSGATSRSG